MDVKELRSQIFCWSISDENFKQKVDIFIDYILLKLRLWTRASLKPRFWTSASYLLVQQNEVNKYNCNHKDFVFIYL